MSYRLLALCSTALVAFVQPALAQTAAVAPAPLATLAAQVTIPYDQFTLPNGLRVVVNTDRRTPFVAVGVWYDVGSRHEPRGLTGFAHLFEHLMFTGSENVPGEFIAAIEGLGAVDVNGTTTKDRTNYFETVPVSALERTLFMESDRMGYLLGVVTSAKIARERGVVQNEKRLGDNDAFGMVDYKVDAGLFPAGHPFAHSVIGSMADLDAATPEAVRGWFHDHYGPNNAVLSLSGDIDVATAKRLVTHYFGAIKAGPPSVAPPVPIPTLPAVKAETITDRVPAVRVSRYWSVPGGRDPASVSLRIAANVLAGQASGRLKTALETNEKLVDEVSARAVPAPHVSQFEIAAMVKKGVDPRRVERRIDEIVADLIRTGPTAEEVRRVVTLQVVNRISATEGLGGFQGKGPTLASGLLFYGDAGWYRTELARFAAQTPETVRAAMATWLTRPAYQLTVVPGARAAYEEAATAPPATAPAETPPAPVAGTRGPLPPIEGADRLTPPKIERARLRNGIELVYTRTASVPLTQITLGFDAGTAADVPGKLGTARLTFDLLREGSAGFDAATLPATMELLGMESRIAQSADRSDVTVRVPSVNLPGALTLLADMVRRPAFDPAAVARVRARQVAAIEQELASPEGLSERALALLAYGPDHPYAKEQGSGIAAAVATVTRDDVAAFHGAWLRPDKAKFYVASDRPLAEVRAAIEAAFGDWRGAGAPGVKTFATPPRPVSPRIVLIDRPDSPQSMIRGVAPNALKGTQDLLAAQFANNALGAKFSGRLTRDLREEKHWAYYVYGAFADTVEAAPYEVQTSVQADRTGPAIASLRQQIAGFVGDSPLTPAELDALRTSELKSLPGQFMSAQATLATIAENDRLRRPDDYIATLSARYRGFTTPVLDRAMREAIDPARMVWVVVGDARIVRPQLDGLGLPVEILPAATLAAGRLPGE